MYHKAGSCEKVPNEIMPAIFYVIAQFTVVRAYPSVAKDFEEQEKSDGERLGNRSNWQGHI